MLIHPVVSTVPRRAPRISATCSAGLFLQMGLEISVGRRIAEKIAFGWIAFLLSACTLTDVERKVGTEETYLVTGTASCLGLCDPEREEIHEAMHAMCSWPAIPAIQARGSDDNGLLGVPHAVWRFTCLTVTPETDVASAGSRGREGVMPR